MVSYFKLLATLFILNFASSLYAKKQVQPANDNEAKKAEASSSPPALSTGSDFIVNFDKLTKQNVFNKGEDENEITENDDDRIWIIRDDNIDEILNNTSNIGTDVINNYELTNPEGETEKPQKLADTRKKTNKKLSKSKDNRNNFTNILTTVEPDKNYIEENGHENPTKSEIHAYNSVKKQESQVSITFSNDGDKKSNDIISYKNKNNSSDSIIIQRLVNILLGKMAGTIGNTAPKMLAVLKKQQMLGESPVLTINDSKSTELNTFSNNTDELNRNPKKPIEPEGEVNEETNKTSDTIQTITAFEKIQAPSDSTLIETKIIQNRNLNSFGSDLTQPRNLLTIINSGIIKNMQATVPLEGHNLIFNDKIITPGIHIVTANITSEEYMASVADMITTLSFERKADLKILGKKAKIKLVQALIKSIEEGMVLIINSGSINGLSLRLPGTDKSKPKESTTEIPTTEVATDDDVKITTENRDDKTNTENPYLEIITKKTSASLIDTDATSKSVYADNLTGKDTYSETTIKHPETEQTTQSTNLKTTTQTRNTSVASTELDIERTTIAQNPKDAFTKNETIHSIEKTTNNRIYSSSPNSVNVTTGYSVRHEVSTVDLAVNSITSRDKITHDISTHLSNQSNTEITSDNIQNYTKHEVFNSVPHIENIIQNQVSEIVTEHIESGRRLMKTDTQHLKTTSILDKPTEAVVKTTAKETNKGTLDSYINNECSQSNDKLFKENTFWHLNHILPHDHNLDKRIYANSHYVNTKREITYKKSDSDTLISNIGTTSENYEIKNTNLEKIDFKSTETKYKEADTLRYKVKRSLGSNFPMLGLLEQVNDGKKIKALKSYLKLLLEFAGNSEEENTSQSFKRQFYEEQDELEPLNTKF